MTMTSTPLAPRRSQLDRATAHALAVEEGRRMAEAVAALGDDDWARPTDCTDWNVKQLISHVIGNALLMASPLESIRQLRAAKKRHQPGTEFVDALTAMQVERYAHLPTSELVQLAAVAGARGAKGRRRLPGFVCSRVASEETVNGVVEPWTMGYLAHTILTRDSWMHRVDLARATGYELVLTAEHDGVIVADVVAEWAERHGQPYRLTLTGPAGATFASGDVGEQIEVDAVEFCRVLSGRGTGTGLLATEVPF